ncbi:MAG: hypothetical protein KGI49_01195, partial [Patescibacteria group bacterium]|nr:hypothetical protein [Patescibacteria group bacterium]
MKRKIDWLQFGQYLAIWNELWTIAKNEFTKHNIGPGILEYVRGPGRGTFMLFLGEISAGYLKDQEFQKAMATRRARPLIADVDLDADPAAPFNGARLTKHQKLGKARFEYRPDEDELYINSKKFVPWLSPEQSSGGTIRGIELEPEANKHGSLNATAADWIFEHQEFMPKKHRGKVWYFWASEWSDSDGDRCVRYLRWDGDRWIRHYF